MQFCKSQDANLKISHSREPANCQETTNKWTSLQSAPCKHNHHRIPELKIHPQRHIHSWLKHKLILDEKPNPFGKQSRFPQKTFVSARKSLSFLPNSRDALINWGTCYFSLLCFYKLALSELQWGVAVIRFTAVGWSGIRDCVDNGMKQWRKHTCAPLK